MLHFSKKICKINIKILKKFLKILKKVKVFRIFASKKKIWQVLAARNNLLFPATDTCQIFFDENITKHFTFFNFSIIIFLKIKFIFKTLVTSNCCISTKSLLYSSNS